MQNTPLSPCARNISVDWNITISNYGLSSLSAIFPHDCLGRQEIHVKTMYEIHKYLLTPGLLQQRTDNDNKGRDTCGNNTVLKTKPHM